MLDYPKRAWQGHNTSVGREDLLVFVIIATPGTLMDGLTAKVFRTYNASFTLQQQLKEQTASKSDQPNLVLTYNRANRAVAVLCNHQVPRLSLLQ